LAPNSIISQFSSASIKKPVLVWLIAISALSAVAIWMAPLDFFSTDIIPLVVVGTVFALLLVVVLGLAITRNQPMRVIIYRLTLLIWWTVLVCETIFDRLGDRTQASESHFSVQAYGEGIVWVLAFLALAALSLQRPQYLRRLFSGLNKWITLFALVCVFSVAYTPARTYAGAWAFKLVLVTLLLQLSASVLGGIGDIVTFLRVSLWGFFVLTVVPAVETFGDPSSAFEGVGGRLNTLPGPDALTLTGALLLLLSVILYSLEKNRVMIFTGFVASIVMIMSMGKSAILASLFSVMLFLLLQKQLGRSIIVLLGIGAVAFGVLSLTPVAQHLESYQGATTLTGRTVIWSEGLAAMKQKWLLGHGYLSSYFDTVGHLHNGFLEVTYNSGIIALAIMLVLHFMILRNSYLAIRDAALLRAERPYDRESSRAYILAVGSLALYANLTINGMFNATFGGRPKSPFMLFIALFLLVNLLRRYIANKLGSEAADERLEPAWVPVGAPARS
jgi:hypothetical protein